MDTQHDQAQPLISVIIPVFNGEKYLAEAVESIRRQQYSPIELIVVDDASTDRTAEIVRSLQLDVLDVLDVHYVFQPNSGPSAARNSGLAVARGSIIAFQDADDLWPPDKLALQLPRLIDDPELDIVSGRIQRIKSIGAKDGKEVFHEILNPIFASNLGSGLYRKSVFNRVGLFDVTMRLCEDFDWWMRARESNARILVLQQVTLLYRLHETNITKGQEERGIQFLGALKKSMDRRRQSDGSVRSPLPLFTDFDEAVK